MTLQVSVNRTNIDAVLALCAAEQIIERIWKRDATVWTDPVEPEITNRLGWLNLSETSRPLLPTIEALADAALVEGITDVVLCGMGGSSLAPEVFASSIPHADGYPSLTVLDTTHPDAVASVTNGLTLNSTWFVISSKSGGTLETMSLFEHFWAAVAQTSPNPGRQFIAVTDPGSSLAELADARDFRATVLADPNVGGRYSALTAFGLVPAGLTGADLTRLLDSVGRAEQQCRPTTSPDQNPGLLVGATLGARAVDGDRVAYFEASTPAESLPVWAEQLIAESTGKDGLGILPVAGGPQPSDQSAVVVSLGASVTPSADVSLAFDDPYEIAGAMFVLEFATAVAGSLIGIHPFDQPDVQLAKKLAHESMSGSLKLSGPDPIAPSSAVNALTAALVQAPTYVAIHAYIAPTDDADAALSHFADELATATASFVTVGYGPRFLHSTGQLHKGGFAGGVFIQLTDRATHTVRVPASDFSFNDLIVGQAIGDGAALIERGRTVVSIDLGTDAVGAINALTTDVAAATEI